MSATALIKTLPCPHCHTIPSIEDGFRGQFVVFCDSDSCAGYGERQAMGKTAAEAIALWNERECENEALGCGGMK